jgi:tetratricopeptide (TPR) repeat protein
VLEKGDDARLDRDVKLVSLYRRVGRGKDAARLYKELLGKPIVNPAFWLEGAEFLGARNDPAGASQFLEKLAELPLKPGEFEIVLAELTEKWKSPEDALKQFQTAIKIAPRSVAAWQALVSFYFRYQRFADAASVTADALKSVPDDSTLRALHSHATALAALGNVEEFGPLIAALCRDPRNEGATEMLAAIVAARETKGAAPELATRIRAIADRHRENLYLQTQAVRSLVRAGKNDTALDIALRLEATDSRSIKRKKRRRSGGNARSTTRCRPIWPWREFTCNSRGRTLAARSTL